ncbi:MAG TPA: type II secretion system protein GspM [Desulfuromonadales bacterium]|nr:type II secretion system protein GspM [Desulfuromonadales bacterium]
MASITEKYKTLVSRLDRLTPRERVLIVAAVLAVLYFPWQRGLWQPLQMQQAALRSQLQQTQVKTAELAAQAQAVMARRNVDPNRAEKKKIAALQADIARLDTRLDAAMVGLVSPQQMPQVLEDLLKRQTGLHLVRLENLPAVPVNLAKTGGATGSSSAPKAVAAASRSDAPRLYRHTLQIEFEGDYMSTLRYLQAIEHLPRRLFWLGIEYKVEHYPKARVVLTVETLSLRKGWIGV